MMRGPAPLFALLLLLPACGSDGDSSGPSSSPAAAGSSAKSASSTAAAPPRSAKKQRGRSARAAPAARARRRLQAMHHARWVRGDINAARSGLASGRGAAAAEDRFTGEGQPAGPEKRQDGLHESG